MKSFSSLFNFLLFHNIYFKVFEFDDVSFYSSIIDKEINKDILFKTVLFIDENNNPYLFLINAKYKILQKKLAKILNIKNLRLANDEEVIKYTGYVPGGISPFDINLKLYIDKEILNYEKVLVGGGDRKHLIEVYVKDILKYNNYELLEIPKKLRNSE